jgi:hypothetical protein
VLALLKSDGARSSVDDRRHVGIVVADRRAVAEVLGVDQGDRLDVVDPWGNHVQVVDYAEFRFRKAPEVQEALGLDGPREVARGRPRARGSRPRACGHFVTLF